MDITNVDFFAKEIVASILVIVFTSIILTVLTKLARKNRAKLEITQGRKATYFHFLYSIVKYAIIAFALVAVLEINGVDVTGILAGVGIASAIIGLALQDEIKDAIMGFHFLTDNFFQVGDVVQYKDIRGKVLGYNLKYVRLEDMDDYSIVSICNRNITEITRCSNQFLLDIDLSYEDEYEKIISVLKHCCEELKKNPIIENCEFLGTQSFNESTVSYRLRLFCNPELRGSVRRTSLGYIRQELKENGIEIPYSKLELIQK